MTDLPSCPLCDASPEPRRPWLGSEGVNVRCGSVACSLHLQLFRTDVWRALAALRKPMAEQDADALVERYWRARREMGAPHNTQAHVLVEFSEATAALGRALTGKR